MPQSKPRKAEAAAALLFIASLIPVGTLRADDGPDLTDLDQRVKVLERLVENQQDELDQAKKSAPVVTADPVHGFSLSSADGSYGLKLGGLVQIDDRTFFDDWVKPQADTILPRRVRLKEDVKLGKNAAIHFQEDLTANPVVYDAYGELKPNVWTTLKIGLQKTPLSLERWRSDAGRDFVEFAYLDSLVTDRDTGAWLEFSDPDQAFLLGGGAFDGSNDTGTPVIADTNKDKDGVAKLFLQPFRWTDTVDWRNVGLGVAGSVGDHNASPASPLVTVKSLGQGQTIFSPTGAGGNDEYRLVPQGYAFWRNLGVLAEYIRTGEEYRTTAAAGQSWYLHNEAWDAQASWVLTGEDDGFDGIRLGSASHPFGALELVARYQGVNFDHGFYRAGLTAPGTSVSSLQAWDGGLNYIPTNGVKILLDYAQTDFANGQTFGKRTANLPAERVLFTRVQFAY